MEKVISSINEIQKINRAYGIPMENIAELLDEIADAKVCTPIIGKFSSGKSALVNTVLGYRRKILKEDITPETAIPAEIIYTDYDELITIIQNDGTDQRISVDEYRRYEADASTVKCARIQLRNSFLEKIPDVMLVDMPGFESGYEIHNKAIDNYLPQSLAYVIAFPADDMIVRSSVGNILKELCLHDMPLCVAITKCDKRNDEFDLTFTKMKESLARFVGEREIRYCKTSSRNGDAEELEEFLLEIQEKSQDIFAQKYKKITLAIAENTENYLRTVLNGNQLSVSKLDEEEEKLHRQFDSLESKFSTEKADFELEISECVEEIKSDVQNALEAEESRLVAMVMNNQSINDHLNSVVRNAVTVGVKNHLMPKVERYVKRVAKILKSESIGNVNISFTFDTDKFNKGVTSSIVAVIAGLVLGLPLLGIIAGVLMKLIKDKKREEAKQNVLMKLRSEVFPQILKEVGSGLDKAITEQITLVNASIQDEFKNQKDTLEKAMADIRDKINDESTRKENLEKEIVSDLERIGEIKDGLR